MASSKSHAGKYCYLDWLVMGKGSEESGKRLGARLLDKLQETKSYQIYLFIMFFARETSDSHFCLHVLLFFLCS